MIRKMKTQINMYNIFFVAEKDDFTLISDF